MLIVLITNQCKSDSMYHTADNADKRTWLDHKCLRTAVKQSQEKVITFYLTDMCKYYVLIREGKFRKSNRT